MPRTTPPLAVAVTRIFSPACQLLTLVALCGCAATPPPVEATRVAPPPDKPEPTLHFETRVATPLARDLGRVAFSCQPAKVDLALERLPLNRADSATQQRDRMLNDLRSAPQGDPGGAIVLYPAVMGLSLAGSWLYGAFSGMDQAELTQATAAIGAASREFDLVEQLSAAIQAQAPHLPATEFASLSAIEPSTPPATRLRLRATESGMIRPVPGTPPPHPLAERGIDTIAILHVSTHTLRGDNRTRPPLALGIAVQLRLFRTSDWQPRGDVVVICQSSPRDLFEWSRDDARALRRTWHDAVAGTKQRLIEALTPAR